MNLSSLEGSGCALREMERVGAKAKTKAEGVYDSESLPVEIMKRIFSSLSLADLVCSMAVCREWRAVIAENQSLISLIKLYASSCLVLRTKDPNNSIQGFTCRDTLVAYGVRHLQGLWGSYGTTVYQEDVCSGQCTRYPSKRDFWYFLHITPKSLLIGQSEKYDSSKHAGTDFAAYSLGKNIPDIITKNQDVEYFYALDSVTGYVAAVSSYGKPECKIFNKKGELVKSIKIKHCIDKNRVWFCSSLVLKNKAMHLLLHDYSHKQLSAYVEWMDIEKSDSYTTWTDLSLEKPMAMVMGDKWIAVPCEGGEVAVFDATTKLLTQKMAVPELANNISKSSSSSKWLQIHGDLLLVQSKDNRLFVIDIRDGSYHVMPEKISCFACFSPALLVVPEDKENHRIEAWDLEKIPQSYVNIGSWKTAGKVSELCINDVGDNPCLVAALEGGQVQVWHPGISKGAGDSMGMRQIMTTVKNSLDWLKNRKIWDLTLP